jgi:hypothetical protein
MMAIRLLVQRHSPGGSVKRSLAMALPDAQKTIAKAFGLDAATRNSNRAEA